MPESGFTKQRFVLKVNGIVITLLIEVLIAKLLMDNNNGVVLFGIISTAIGILGNMLTEYTAGVIIKMFKKNREERDERKSTDAK